jgi:CHAT domain-containing protein
VADASYEPRYVAIVVRPGRELPTRVELGPAEPIDQAINDWLEQVEHGKDERDLDPPGRRLRRALWEPLAPALDGAGRVLISPDGLLNFLPWGALPGHAPGTYLLSERAFATVIAARQLVAGRQLRAQVAGGLLTVGGVDYSQADDASDRPHAELLASRTRSAPIVRGSFHFDPLEKTGAEAQAVEDKFHQFVEAGRTRTPEAVRLTGSTATKQRVLEVIHGSRFLHLATHGYFSPLRSVADSDPEADLNLTRSGVERPDEAPTLFPGLLSALVFAGANRPQNDPLTGAADFGAGIMTAEEVAGLDLSACELAVLSACETGRGRITGGEGVLGLQRSFHAAGARTVVASLWRVDDEATRELMTNYYDNLWRRKLGSLEALRQAQLNVLHGGTAAGKVRSIGATEPEPITVAVVRTHPRYWAAWVLSGDPGEPSNPADEPSPITHTLGAGKPAPAIRWALVALSVLLLALLVLIAWFWRKRSSN